MMLALTLILAAALFLALILLGEDHHEMVVDLLRGVMYALVMVALIAVGARLVLSILPMP